MSEKFRPGPFLVERVPDGVPAAEFRAKRPPRDQNGIFAQLDLKPGERTVLDRRGDFLRLGWKNHEERVARLLPEEQKPRRAPFPVTAEVEKRFRLFHFGQICGFQRARRVGPDREVGNIFLTKKNLARCREFPEFKRRQKRHGKRLVRERERFVHVRRRAFQRRFFLRRGSCAEATATSAQSEDRLDAVRLLAVGHAQVGPHRVAQTGVSHGPAEAPEAAGRLAPLQPIFFQNFRLFFELVERPGRVGDPGHFRPDQKRRTVVKRFARNERLAAGSRGVPNVSFPHEERRFALRPVQKTFCPFSRFRVKVTAKRTVLWLHGLPPFRCRYDPFPRREMVGIKAREFQRRQLRQRRVRDWSVKNHRFSRLDQGRERFRLLSGRVAPDAFRDRQRTLVNDQIGVLRGLSDLEKRAVFQHQVPKTKRSGKLRALLAFVPDEIEPVVILEAEVNFLFRRFRRDLIRTGRFTRWKAGNQLVRFSAVRQRFLRVREPDAVDLDAQFFSDRFPLTIERKLEPLHDVPAVTELEVRIQPQHVKMIVLSPGLDPRTGDQLRLAAALDRDGGMEERAAVGRVSAHPKDEFPLRRRFVLEVGVNPLGAEIFGGGHRHFQGVRPGLFQPHPGPGTRRGRDEMELRKFHAFRLLSKQDEREEEKE